jgi:hypothetical protein
MTAKPPAPDEFRMSVSEFDKMMRGALSAPPPPKAATTKPRRAKKRKTTIKK